MNETVAIVLLTVVTVVVWVAVLVWATWQIVLETTSSPVARVLWICVVVGLPVFGPVIWALVRWQIPSYGSAPQ